MTKYEYKTVTLKQKLGLVSRKIPDLEDMLNREGGEGWQLCEVIIPSALFGDSDKVILIFERALE